MDYTKALADIELLGKTGKNLNILTSEEALNIYMVVSGKNINEIMEEDNGKLDSQTGY